MSKEQLIEQLIKAGVYRMEDKQLYELSIKELKKLLEGREWENESI